MIARLRRQRWIGAFLVLLTPAMGPRTMPMGQPCPAHSSGAMAMPMAAMPGHHHQTPGGQQQSHDCTCIGCCHSAPPATMVRAEVVARIVAGQRHAGWPVIEHVSRIAEALDRLPQATAPPLA